MLGFHSDGIRLYGASDTLKAQLKKRKLPITGQITGNTIVVSINDAEIVQKRPYSISFAAATTPWFICTLEQEEAQFPLTLPFASEMDLVEWIQAVYYASQEFLHLDVELSFLKQTFSQVQGRVIRAYHEEEFGEIPKDSPVLCFYFGNGGFLETDRIFAVLSQEHGLDISKITLGGSFASKRSMLTAFALAEREV